MRYLAALLIAGALALGASDADAKSGGREVACATFYAAYSRAFDMPPGWVGGKISSNLKTLGGRTCLLFPPTESRGPAP